MTGKTIKTINQILTKKVDAWLESIEDDKLRAACKKDVIVTGGSIASMLLGEKVNDYDLYFRTYDTVKKVAEYYLEKFQAGRSAKLQALGRTEPMAMYLEELTDSHGRQRIRIVVRSAGVAGEQEQTDYRYFETHDGTDTEDAGEFLDTTYAEGEVTEGMVPEKPMFHPVFLSSNAISLKGEIQLIIRFHGGPEAIHENFDFIHCMNYWTPKEGVVVNPESLLALMSRTLMYRGSLYPICSVFRAKKFIQRGWSINAGQYLKMCLQIGQLDLTNYKILEEQLTGVDVAYFSEVLAKAKKEDSDVIDTAYLVEIINRMF